MRRKIMTALLSTTLLGTALAMLTQGPVHIPGPEEKIRALEEAEARAVLDQDFALLERLWAEDFIVNAPNNAVFTGRDMVLEGFRQGIATYEAFDRRIEHVRVDDDRIYVLGGETVKPILTADLAGQTVERRFTHVWQRNGDGNWYLLVRHANNVHDTRQAGPGKAPAERENSLVSAEPGFTAAGTD
jgi:ketosteroid isomerase-like protein